MTITNIQNENNKNIFGIPRFPLILGAMGLIPFWGCTIYSLLGPVETSNLTQTFVLFYGAIILSFLGGVHWGCAISRSKQSTHYKKHLIFSVIPSLLGWPALMLPQDIGIAILMIGFVLTLLIDIFFSEISSIPKWYPKLRKPLSVSVIVCLIIATLT